MQKTTDGHTKEADQVGVAKERRSCRSRRCMVRLPLLKKPTTDPGYRCTLQLSWMATVGGRKTAGCPVWPAIRLAWTAFKGRWSAWAPGGSNSSPFRLSTENWNRPEEEVRGILEILYDAIRQQTKTLHDNNVRIKHIGKSDHLSQELGTAVLQAQELTEANTGITLNVAFDYGGRDEILEAVRGVIRDGVPAGELTEDRFNSYLFTSHCPDPT